MDFLLDYRSKPRLDSREAASLGNSFSEFRVALVEVLHSSLQDLAGHSLHASKDVLNGVLPDLSAEDLSEEGSGLSEVTVGVVGAVPGNKSGDSVRAVPCLLVEVEEVGVGGSERVGLIIGSRA